MSGPTNYQWVITSTNYDGTAAPKYLKFDGVDDYLNLPYMGLYANGSASAVVGVQTNSTTTYDCIVAERSASAGTTVPMYQFVRTETGLDSDSFIRNEGGVIILNTNGIANVFPSGGAVILSSIDTGYSMTNTKNSTIKATEYYTRSGVVSVGNTTLMASLVGASASDQLNGSIYGLIITKSALSDADRRKCEVYLGRKSGVQL